MAVPSPIPPQPRYWRGMVQCGRPRAVVPREGRHHDGGGATGSNSSSPPLVVLRTNSLRRCRRISPASGPPPIYLSCEHLVPAACCCGFLISGVFPVGSLCILEGVRPCSWLLRCCPRGWCVPSVSSTPSRSIGFPPPYPRRKPASGRAPSRHVPSCCSVRGIGVRASRRIRGRDTNRT